jgi:hypothetical protein
MTPEELDDIVYQFGPKPAAAPAFIEAGLQWLAQPASIAPMPEPEVFDGEAHIAGLDPELQARLERNQRLASTDFFALSDRVMPPEIAAYRQALRDLPQSDDWAPRLVWDPLKGVVALGVGWPEVG